MQNAQHKRGNLRLVLARAAVVVVAEEEVVVVADRLRLLMGIRMVDHRRL